MNYVGSQLKEEAIIFSDTLTAGTKTTYEKELTGNGYISKVHVNFATGENGTLHLRPYVILNGNITIDLLNYAGNKYIAGDSEYFDFNISIPIETKSIICLDAENTGSNDSMVDCFVTVVYEDFIKAKSIVGYEGVNL